MKTLVTALAITSTTLAQQTLVVDAGGGTPFQQIQPAISAAAAGDLIEVRPGVYQPFVCSKAVRIFGSAGAVVAETFTTTAITVDNIPAGSTCAIGGLELRSPTTPCICEPSVRVNQCDGLVILDTIRPNLPSLEPRIEATSVAGLILRDSFVGPVTSNASVVHLDTTTVDTASRTTGALIDLIDSELSMTDGLIRTHQGTGPNFAIRLANSRARLRVVQSLNIGLNQGNHDFFVDGTSQLDYDPATTFAPLGTPTIWPFGPVGPVTANAMPALRVTSAGPGGTVQIQMRYTVAPGFLCTFLAAPGAPVTVPGIDGSLFFSGSLIAQIGCFPTGPNIVFAGFTIPNDPTMSGLLFTAQGIALGGSFPATNADALRIL
ncbi:MAG: lytic polysaccharide monooxygenase auxiliary activity family 9 protein [bacterium]|nr:lytic polysaccharide monooxygenase auxiliary activity family 9 protein [bacterium]